MGYYIGERNDLTHCCIESRHLVDYRRLDFLGYLVVRLLRRSAGAVPQGHQSGAGARCFGHRYQYPADYGRSSSCKIVNLTDNQVISLGVYNHPALAPCATSGAASIFAFGRITYIGNSTILTFGGGHVVDPIDYVDRLDLTASQIQWVIDQPNTPVAEMITSNFDNVKGWWTSSGHPVSRHVYDQLPWCSATQELILIANGVTDMHCTTVPFETNRKYQIAHYNPVTKVWRSSAAIGTYATVDYVSAKEDPVSGKIIIVTNTSFHVYDPIAETCTKINGITFPSLMGTSQNLVYFPLNQKMYYMRYTGSVFEITLNRSNWSQSTIVKLTTTGPAPNFPIVDTGFAVDDINHVICGAALNGVMYIFDPITKVWTTQTMNGPLVSQLKFHCIDFVHSENVFAMIANTPAVTFLWRYKNLPPFPTFPVPDPFPTNFSAIAPYVENEYNRRITFIEQVDNMAIATQADLDAAVAEMTAATQAEHDQVLAAIAAVQVEGLTTDQLNAAKAAIITAIQNVYAAP